MSARRGPRPTSERLRRLLVMLPWLMERGEVPVAEMAERFELTEEQLVKDIELVAMCGLPPFVDEMIDVFIDDGMVSTGVPRLFTRPLRLTAPEGFALLAAARVAMQLPGADADGALARALRKLAAALGDDAVVVETAAAAGRRRDRRGRRRVRRACASRTGRPPPTSRASARSPRAGVPRRGHWYVIADDHRSGEERTFRIDRIESCERTGVDRRSRARWRPRPATSGSPTPSCPWPVLRLLAAAGWVAERYPTRSVQPDGDGTVVELTVASERWLRELLLRLGPSAHGAGAAEWVRPRCRRRLRALLARYDAEGSDAN